MGNCNKPPPAHEWHFRRTCSRQSPNFQSHAARGYLVGRPANGGLLGRSSTYIPTSYLPRYVGNP